MPRQLGMLRYAVRSGGYRQTEPIGWGGFLGKLWGVGHEHRRQREEHDAINPAANAKWWGWVMAAAKTVAAMARQWERRAARWWRSTRTVAVWRRPGTLPAPHIGAPCHQGLGTGGEPRMGQRGGIDIEAIRGLFRDVDMAFPRGLSGAARVPARPLLVEEARKSGALTLCFASLPFEFEGKTPDGARPAGFDGSASGRRCRYLPAQSAAVLEPGGQD